MPKAVLATALILGVGLSGLTPGGTAMGSIGQPSAVLPVTKPAPATSPSRVERVARRVSSYYTQMRAEVLARLRPVERENPIDFDEATALLNRKTVNEKIFGKDMTGKMKNEYTSKVAPWEATATDPIWRPRYWEVERYEQGREDLARWTAREVLDDQLKAFFHGGDKDSAPMKVLSTARELTGGGEDKPAEPKLTPEEKIARAHRTDLPAAPEEEKIPTKVRTKLNLIKQHGSVVFTNPIAITSLNGNKDDISLTMNKDFRKLTLRSNVGYTVKQECLNFNLNKKITDQVTLDLDHYNYTGGKRGASGEKTKEQARVNYSISF